VQEAGIAAPSVKEGVAEPLSASLRATNDEVLRRLIVSYRDLLVQLQSGEEAMDNGRFCHLMLTFCHFCGALGDKGMAYDAQSGVWSCRSCGEMAAFEGQG
jgi:hypothetical protein